LRIEAAQQLAVTRGGQLADTGDGVFLGDAAQYLQVGQGMAGISPGGAVWGTEGGLDQLTGVDGVAAFSGAAEESL
jgi:hypothetical protein